MANFDIELEWNISNGNEPVNEITIDKGRNISRERFLATRKANKKLREIPTFTSSVRFTRNGGIIHKGNTYSWHPAWKKLDHHISRNDGKKEIADFFADDSQPFDAWADWDNNFPTREDGTIDLYTLLKYDEDDDDDDLGEDVYDTIYDLEQDITKLRREINLYKDFLGEYNLGKLYEEWLARNGKGKEESK